jgi:AbrB family looped-hinge helix DNA binding protein
MDIARVSSKGQITIPIDIRRKLKLQEGDKVIFVEENGNITLKNSNLVAWERIQKAFEGEAERVGWTSEEDVIEYCKQIRIEMGRERGYID